MKYYISYIKFYIILKKALDEVQFIFKAKKISQVVISN